MGALSWSRHMKLKFLHGERAGVGGGDGALTYQERWVEISLMGMKVILLGHTMPWESKRTCPSDPLMPPTYPLALRCLLPAHILGGLFLMRANGRL